MEFGFCCEITPNFHFTKVKDEKNYVKRAAVAFSYISQDIIIF